MSGPHKGNYPKSRRPMMPHHLYGTYELDRRHELRDDREWIAARLGDDTTRVAVVWRDKSLAVDSEAPEVFYVEPARLSERVEPGTLTFLGTSGDVAYFAADVSDVDEPVAAL